ncbi:hypothetical protein L3Q82_011478 [Scortum barcoo]|uniref:Uncharacterized protein n=1 Tax=Scortum barcoo TaxID=214431 RepID=A0ACB8WAM2_9TELE|nr:hypothetical protein L3Q82_011478 [Scortum barcoo]
MQPASFSTVLWHSFRQSILKPFSSSPGISTTLPLSATLPNFHQDVNCCTGTIKLWTCCLQTQQAYSSSPLPPLGRSDHNLVHLRPVYTPVVKRQPPNKRRVKQDIDSLTDCITDYINFCVETTVPTKRVRCFSNNKPWVTPDLRALLQEKRRAFQSGDRDELRRVQRDLKRKIKECKASYRRKMEDHLQQNNAREVWRGLQAISGQDQLCQVVCYIFNLSLSLERVPVLWKTSCVVPVPKTSRPKEPNHFRPVALTSHLMKALERIVLRHLRPLVSPNMDPLQFAYQPGIGVDDAVIYLLQRSLSHLEDAGNTETLVKLERAGVSDQLAAWVTNYLTDRPQFVRLQDCVSDVVVCSTGAPQGTVLSPFLFTLYTSDFTYSTDSCHLQKFSDDTAIVGCVSEGNDSGNPHPDIAPVNIQGLDIERVRTYKYLGVHLNNKLDWTDNTDSLYKKGQSRLYMLRRLGSFGVCRPLLRTFYETVVASVVSYAVVCWGGGCSERDKKRLNRLIKRASSVCGCPLDSIEVMGERRALAKTVHHHGQHLPPSASDCGGLKQLLQQQTQTHPRCRKERFRRSFIPNTIRLFNAAL